MLDIHLATLYRLEIDIFRETVKQNAQRFPEAAVFQLTNREWTDVQPFISLPKSSSLQILTTNAFTLPYAFSEQAITILGGLFSSSIIIKMNIAIMKAWG